MSVACALFAVNALSVRDWAAVLDIADAVVRSLAWDVGAVVNAARVHQILQI